MVKHLLLLLLLFNSALALKIDSKNEEVTLKIKSFLNEKTYENNKEFIDVIFEPKTAFFVNERVNTVKVIETLKQNGLLKLFFNTPRELKLNFKTSGAPLFFVKIMADTLRSIGYYRYVTTASNLDASEFTWNINLTSEYATDPLILDKELTKRGCKIIDITMNSLSEWTYVIDISRGYLNVVELIANQDVKLKRSIYAHWLDISKIKELTIRSSRKNSWYPSIAYYDSSLHLLKVTKKNYISRKIYLDIPQNSKYIKISDLYTLKNVRDSLHLFPSSAR